MNPTCPSDLLECSSARAANLPPLLHALWHDAHGDWERAHTITQDIDSPEASWLHAYLHRKEGSDWNAAYWYRQANRIAYTGSLHAEWTALATRLLTASPPVQASTTGPRVGV